jgi:hypothetical protein
MDSLKELDTALVTSRVVPPTKAADAATQTAGADDTSVEEQYPQYEQVGSTPAVLKAIHQRATSSTRVVVCRLERFMYCKC